MLLDVQGLKKTFSRRPWSVSLPRERVVPAIDGISFVLDQGESLGIVGQSGCGKTTLARAIVGLIRPSEGRVLFNGVDIGRADARQRMSLRRECRMIFQGIETVLNPYMNVRQILEEPLKLHTSLPPRLCEQALVSSLDRVNLPPSVLGEFPHALSGGEKRRVSIARVIIVPPNLIVADEPVASLDACIRGQVLQLLKDLQHDLNMAMIVISHDLGAVSAVCSRIAVMFAGRFVEISVADASAGHVLSHPYSRKLFSSALQLHAGMHGKMVPPATGRLPREATPDGGCRYRGSCDRFEAADRPGICANVIPQLVERSATNSAACHLE